MSGLQAALPRHHYVEPEAFRRERERVLLDSWTCVGRLDVLGLAPRWHRRARARSARRRRPARRVGARHHDPRRRAAARTPTSAGTAARRSSPSTPPSRHPSRAPCGALRCPYHSWTYDLDGRLIKAPHTDDVEDFDPAAFSLHPLGRRRLGRLPVAARRHRPPRRRCSTSSGPVPDRVRRYPLDRLVVGRRLTYSVAANWKVLAENYNECYHCGPVHPELTRLVPAFGGGGQDLPWEDGIPHREGAWTFTLSGTSDRQPVPRPRRERAGPAQGRARLPQPAPVAVRRPRGRVHAVARRPSTAPRSSASCCSPPTRSPSRRSTRPTPRSSGTSRTAQDWAICESVQRGMSSRSYTGGWYAPMEDASLDIRRWLLPRLGDEARRRWRGTRGRVDGRTYDVAVVGLGGLGSATAWQLARRGASVLGLEQFSLGHDRGASHDSSRILRHSYHTPGYVALTFEAYDDWADLEDAVRRASSSRSPAASTSSRPASVIPLTDYTSSMDAFELHYDVLDTAEVAARWPQLVAARRHGRAPPGAHRHRARGPDGRRHAATGRGGRRHPRRRRRA